MLSVVRLLALVVASVLFATGQDANSTLLLSPEEDSMPLLGSTEPSEAHVVYNTNGMDAGAEPDGRYRQSIVERTPVLMRDASRNPRDEPKMYQSQLNGKMEPLPLETAQKLKQVFKEDPNASVEGPDLTPHYSGSRDVALHNDVKHSRVYYQHQHGHLRNNLHHLKPKYWYRTCQVEKCYEDATYTFHPEIPKCKEDALGKRCKYQNKHCDPGFGCGVMLICVPKFEKPNCPNEKELIKASKK